METKKPSAYAYKGEVHEIGKTQTFASGFAKRILVLKEQASESKYPNYAVFEFTKSKNEAGQGRVGELDRLTPGDIVEVSFFLDARENPNKPGQWFASNRAYKVEILKHESANSATAYTPERNESEADTDFPF